MAMQVILLSDVEKLGLRGDVVDVAPGYARNFLLPRRLAERATDAKVAELRRRDEQRARHEARSEEQAREIADLLQRTVLRFEVKAGPTGALFGSVTPSDIADEVWRTRKVRVDRRKIALAEPIKRIGRYAVPVEVFGDVAVDVKTLVVPEGGELPPEEELPEINTAEPPAPPPAPEAEAEAEVEAETDTGTPADAPALVEPEPASEPATAEAERPAYEAGDEVDPDPSAQVDQVPDDAFDRAVDVDEPR
jgi:large subunit ribosomal protein L9